MYPLEKMTWTWEMEVCFTSFYSFHLLDSPLLVSSCSSIAYMPHQFLLSLKSFFLYTLRWHLMNLVFIVSFLSFVRFNVRWCNVTPSGTTFEPFLFSSYFVFYCYFTTFCILPVWILQFVTFICLLNLALFLSFSPLLLVPSPFLFVHFWGRLTDLPVTGLPVVIIFYHS